MNTLETLSLYIRHRRTGYTTTLFDMAGSTMKPVAILFPNEHIADISTNHYIKGHTNKIVHPNEFLKRNRIITLSLIDKNIRDKVDYMGNIPIFLDNSTILEILDESIRITNQNKVLKEENDLLKPYRRFTSTDEYFKSEISHREMKIRVLKDVTNILGIKLRSANLIIQFKMPLAVFLSFYFLVFIYLIFAFYNL